MAVTKDQVGAKVIWIAEAFGVAIKPERLTVYYESLKTFDPELFAKVCDHFLTEGERFPLISDFHKVARRKFSREIDGAYSTRHD